MKFMDDDDDELDHTDLPATHTRCVVIVVVVRDYDGQVFLRECNGGLLCSGYPPIAKPAYTEEIPVDLKANPLPEDWDYFSKDYLYCVQKGM